MRTWVLFGIGLGGVMSALSWFGNLWASVPGRISVFPDLITLAVLPVLIFLALRWVAQRHAGATRATVRRAGMLMVGIGATLFAATHTVLGLVLFARPSALLLVVGFAMSFASFVAVGWLTAWAVSTWLIRAGGKR